MFTFQFLSDEIYSYVYQKSHFATWQKNKIDIYVPHFKVFGKDSSLISIIAEIKIFVEFSIFISSKSRTWIFTVGMFINFSRLVLMIIKIENELYEKTGSTGVVFRFKKQNRMDPILVFKF